MIKDRKGDYASRVCDDCGDIRENVSYWNLCKKKTHRCYSCSNRRTNLGRASPFKGTVKEPKHVGRGYVHSDGYPACWVGKDRSKTGYMLTHRLLAGYNRGLPISRCEKVHHVNGVKHDYSIKNLYVCKDMSDHRRVHSQLEDISFELVRMGAIRFCHVSGLYSISDKLKELIELHSDIEEPELISENELKLIIECFVEKIR